MALHEHGELKPPCSARIILVISWTCRSRDAEPKGNERNERNGREESGSFQTIYRDKGCFGEA